VLFLADTPLVADDDTVQAARGMAVTVVNKEQSA
jgi:hypothetical protein